MSEEKAPRHIEVEVTGKHYRPLEGQWQAEGVVIIDGETAPFAARKTDGNWLIEIKMKTKNAQAEQKARKIVEKALSEERRFISFDSSGRRKKVTRRIASEKVTEEIKLAHGGGGTLMFHLLSEIVIPNIKNPTVERLDDSAEINIQSSRIAFTTDSFVVRPLFFPGGDIGRLAVSGTVNDICCLGAKPLALSLSFIFEEGFPISDLKAILKSITQTAKEANVKIVTGDTKVVEKGAADKLFINTAGIGQIPEGVNLSSHNVRAEDSVILTGTVGDHGATVVSLQRGLKLKTSLRSDTAPLNRIVEKLLQKFPNKVHCIKDPTRGGVAAALNEISENSNVAIEIDENAIPTQPEVLGICELLGLDPLSVANEGKLLIFIEQDAAEEALSLIRRQKYGSNAAIIGKTIESDVPVVTMRTSIGGTRIIDMPYGEQLPRIC
jgi:hydrogenase expression/formation protein HypE